MGDRLIYLLAQLSPRERGLILLLGVVVVPLAVVMLGVLPRLDAREAARTSAFEAEAMLAWVAGQVEALPPEGLTAAPETAAAAPIGISGIEQSLVREDLRGVVSELAARPDGGIDLDFEAVAFERLTNWLYFTSPEWGYRIVSFRIERAEPGLVTGSFVLEAAE
ncbi:MAG: type II secretion system protein GspM [Rhodobacter sp.]|nr:type II secretion system protein GspM [Rhodobacter sp.]